MFDGRNWFWWGWRFGNGWVVDVRFILPAGFHRCRDSTTSRALLVRNHWRFPRHPSFHKSLDRVRLFHSYGMFIRRQRFWGYLDGFYWDHYCWRLIGPLRLRGDRNFEGFWQLDVHRGLILLDELRRLSCFFYRIGEDRVYIRNVLDCRAARNSQFDGLWCNPSIASRDVKKDDKYLEGIPKNIHFNVDLFNAVVHRFQSGPHRPGKTRQQDGKEDRGNEILYRSTG